MALLYMLPSSTQMTQKLAKTTSQERQVSTGSSSSSTFPLSSSCSSAASSGSPLSSSSSEEERSPLPGLPSRGLCSATRLLRSSRKSRLSSWPIVKTFSSLLLCQFLPALPLLSSSV